MLPYCLLSAGYGKAGKWESGDSIVRKGAARGMVKRMVEEAGAHGAPACRLGCFPAWYLLDDVKRLEAAKGRKEE